uniref:Peptidase A1 domain-containing protein n=1 Tax=Oryza brachyantha TaxID=4533 RepID=J3LYC0_ORYBR
MRRDPRYPSYYYLNLDGIAVGDNTASLMKPSNATSTAATPSPNATATAPPGVGDANKYGMIIDIASTITFLEASLYDELADDLEEEIRLPRGTGSSLGLDLCFILPDGVPFDRVYVPPVSLAFDGRWLRLDKERLFAEDRESGMMCLMVGRAEPGSVSILGNFQQQNTQDIFTLGKGRGVNAILQQDSIVSEYLRTAFASSWTCGSAAPAKKT